MGKNSYKIGYWTQSTLKTLEYVKQKNASGLKLKATEFENGTLKNWAYVLANGGYLKNDNGFILTQLGEQLLSELQRDPPPDRRGRSKPRIKQNKKTASVAAPSHAIQGYQVSIRGTDIAFDAILSREQAMEAINAVSSLKKKG